MLNYKKKPEFEWKKEKYYQELHNISRTNLELDKYFPQILEFTNSKSFEEIKDLLTEQEKNLFKKFLHLLEK